MTNWNRLERHIEIEADTPPVVECLSQSSGLSKAKIKQAMNKGAVWLTRGKKTQRLRRVTRELKLGDTVHLYYDEQVLSLSSATAQLVADEGAYSVWYKPFGMLSQGSKWGDHCTITRWAEQNLEPKRSAYVVHRIDRAATGLILVAHEKRAAAALSALFKAREVEKRYRVIVHGAPKKSDIPQVIDAPIDDRAAQTTFTVVAINDTEDRALLDVTIDSGRKHQIRRHLAGLGFPVVGDRLYGPAGATEDLCLTAYLLAFRYPLTESDKRYCLQNELLPHL